MIHLNKVTKSYQDPETGESAIILNVLEQTFLKGTHYALYGPSGIGKTTLLHILSGLITPDSGTVTVDSTIVNLLSESQRDKFRAINIGYIFQTFNLIQGFTALENVMLGMMFAGNRNNKKRALEVLDRVGLNNRLHYLPSQLSTGQQQRVCIARALANDPKIILADEPTGNLDPENSKEIMNLVFQEAVNKSLLVVTHEAEVLNWFENKLDMTPFHPKQNL